MKHLLLIAGILIAQSTVAMTENITVNKLINDYRLQGSGVGNAQNGKQLWRKTFPGKAPSTERSCTTCHTDNLKNTGKHTSTGKAIKPLAPSINPERMSDEKTIKKWLKRNCKWTLGRECTAQEKSDILTFINQQ